MVKAGPIRRLIVSGKTEGRGLALGVDDGLTHRCYDPKDEGRPCGSCDWCLLRQKGFDDGRGGPALAAA